MIFLSVVATIGQQQQQQQEATTTTEATSSNALIKIIPKGKGKSTKLRE